MVENMVNEHKEWYERLAAGYVASVVDPERHQILINNLSVALDSDEKIEVFAGRQGLDPEELKNLLKKASQ
jgi:hypothetical protein